MSPNRLPLWRRLTSIAVIAAAVLVVMAWNGGSEPAAASARRGFPTGGGSCPLTETQQLNSIKAFQKMMPVFRHPRCLNCHGIVQDPRASGTPSSHMGVVDLSSADPASTCEECHMDKWHLAPDWTRKNDAQLCSDMKMRRSGAQFGRSYRTPTSRWRPPATISCSWCRARGARWTRPPWPSA